MADRQGPFRLKRGDVEGLAASIYIPQRGGRAPRHFTDTFSRALWVAKQDPTTRREWAHDLARGVGAQSAHLGAGGRW